jgi:hypothetical protein
VRVDQLHTLLSVRIWLHVAGHVGVEDDVQWVCVIVLRPERFRSVIRASVPPGVRILVVYEADPVGVHESRKITVDFGLVRERRSLHGQ